MTTEQATRAAIVSAVRAFLDRGEEKTRFLAIDCCEHCGFVRALRAELAALERAAAAAGAPEGGSQETNK